MSCSADAGVTRALFTIGANTLKMLHRHRGLRDGSG
jgi:hypothetical protein